MKINKGLLAGTVAVALLTGGYYASAQGLPHITLGAPTVGPTTSYAPGTPAWLEYAGSPYRIGGPKGPQPGETWEQFQYHAQPVASGSPSTVHGTPSTVSANSSTSTSAVTTPAAPGANSPNPSASDSPYAKWATLPNLPSGWTWHEVPLSSKPITAVWVPTPNTWVLQSAVAGSYNFGSQEVLSQGTYSYGVEVWQYSGTPQSIANGSIGQGLSFAGSYIAGQEELVSNYTTTSVGYTTEQVRLIADGSSTIDINVIVPDAFQSQLSTIFMDTRFNFS